MRRRSRTGVPPTFILHELWNTTEEGDIQEDGKEEKG